MIEINNLTTVSIEEEFFKKIIQEILEKEGKKDIDLSIAFVGQGKIRKLNKKYRGKNRITDVLAFPESKLFLEKFNINLVQKTKNLGEIAVCLREVRKNAKKYNSNFEKELVRVLIHGVLHLLGYEHEKSENEAEKMTKKEKDYLEPHFKSIFKKSIL